MKQTFSCAVAAIAVVTLLAACSPQDEPTAKPTPAATSASPSDEPTESDSLTPSADPDAKPTVPGYAYGEIPPVPLLVLPDLSMVDAVNAGFAAQFKTLVGTYSGLTVSTAQCEADGSLSSNSGVISDDNFTDYGDGSGTFTLNGVEVYNDGEGGGSYVGAGLEIYTSADGSGTYTDTKNGLKVWVYGDGGGSEESSRGDINITADGSGSHRTEAFEIYNAGDGSGSYIAENLEIHNWGDGTGLVNDVDVPMEPLPPLAPMGVFPPIDALAPVANCGTQITLDSALLFDPNSAEVRRGVPTTLTSVGYGETRPVAPEQVDGVDSPAGRQANRRVEIFIPTF